MTDLISTAVTGTDDYRAFMTAVTVHSMRTAAGFVAPVMAQDDGYLFDVRGKRDIQLVMSNGMIFGLSPEYWIEMIFPKTDTIIRYPYVIVLQNSVVFCWRDAAEIDYEWRQLEITRDGLIEMWESDTP